MSQMNFIRTSDFETAEKLRGAGFTELHETGTSGYVFVNDKNMNFSDEDILNLKYTLSNKLCI